MKEHTKLSKNTKSQEKKSSSPKERIKGAIRTDLILSIEIIVIAKNAIEGPFLTQVLTLIAVGVLASVLIYGLVAVVVKVDDLGLYLIEKKNKVIGQLLVNSMPYIMKTLGIVGTIAMFLVGGGIVSHIFHLPLYLPEILQNLVIGLVVGLMCCALIIPIQKLRTRE